MLGTAVTDLPLDDPDRLNLIFAPLQGEDHVGLAVSGGVDSLALMLLLAKWRAMQNTPPHVMVFTVDHGLREAAKSETEFVAATAEELGFESQILKGVIENPGARLQEKARALRYGLIGQAMEGLGIHCLMTGHHCDDQAETVLMRFSRGSGVNGLAGMATISVRHGLFVFRPLLDLGRGQLETFVAQSGIVPIDDPSNRNMNFERVRWRQFMPALNEAGLSSEMISMSARRLRRADDALAEMTERFYEEEFVIDPFGCLYFDLAALIEHPAEIGVRLLARALDDAGGLTHMPSLAQVEALLENLRSGIFGFKGMTLGGCGIKVKDGIAQIYREVGRLSDVTVEIAPGNSIRWDNRFQIIVAQDLTSPVCVAPAIEFTRKMLDDVLPDLPDVPMQAVRCAPMITQNKQILALGEHALDQGVDVFRVFGPNALI